MATEAKYPGGLVKGEFYWRDHHDWLLQAGYVLRPRFRPGWIPSWQGTKKFYLSCEDGQRYATAQALDAVRKSDGKMVMLKRISRSIHPFEIHIGQHFCSPPLASDPRNHCCPILDVLQDPTNADIQIIVMPFLRAYKNPAFQTVGEAVEFFRQSFEGLHFMHEHHVAHRDCMTLNIMMDPREMYPDMYHPRAINKKRDFTGNAKFYSRTRRPPRYYWTDFGLSRQFDADVANPLEVPIVGGDQTVPEYLEDETVPRNPFHTDVYCLGNLIQEDFLQPYSNLAFMNPLIASMITKEPERRLTMDVAVRELDRIVSKLPGWKLRARLRKRQDNGLLDFLKDVQHAFRATSYLLLRLPPIPTPLTTSERSDRKRGRAARRVIPFRRHSTPPADA